VCTRTTWWQSPYSCLVKLPAPLAATTVTLTVTATGYGGQPDKAAADDATSSYNEAGDGMQIQLAEIGVY
jgi:hypothetical protein